MRPTIIAGNWKMHGSKAQTQALLADFVKRCVNFSQCQWIVFPPAPYLSQARDILNDFQVGLGAQNMHTHDQGPFTGEISPVMLLDLGCQYVLVGHSERRQYHFESNEIVAKKFAAAQAHGLIPILCVGESKQEREQGQTLTILRNQIQAVLDLGGVESFKNAIIAYEPVWAIGTGLTATPQQAQEIHSHIRQWINEASQEIAKSLPILYGGSVKATNASDLLALDDVDGALVGGASLDAREFLAIGKAAEQVICNN